MLGAAATLPKFSQPEGTDKEDAVPWHAQCSCALTGWWHSLAMHSTSRTQLARVPLCWNQTQSARVPLCWNQTQSARVPLCWNQPTLLLIHNPLHFVSALASTQHTSNKFTYSSRTRDELSHSAKTSAVERKTAFTQHNIDGQSHDETHFWDCFLADSSFRGQLHAFLNTLGVGCFRERKQA